MCFSNEITRAMATSSTSNICDYDIYIYILYIYINSDEFIIVHWNIKSVIPRKVSIAICDENTLI